LLRKISKTGIPELGLPANDDSSSDESKTDKNSMLRQEYTTAHSILMQTNRFPITIDKNCLSCMSDGKETNHALKGFKMACLSYAPSQVNYRQGTYQRVELLGIRRGLMEKVVEVMHGCELFENNSVFPRRYFDDLVL